MTNFPTSLDDATSIPVESAGTALSTNHVTNHQNVQDAIEAIEAKIGVDGSAVTTSHDYKLSGVTGTDKAVSLTGTEALTNKTLTAPTITSPKVTVGSDAVGDLHYVSNVDGTLSRLAKGSDNQILKMNGTSLNWEAETSTVNADQTTAGIVEEATAAEITAGTATGGSGASLYVSPDQLALSTPVFSGLGLTNTTRLTRLAGYSPAANTSENDVWTTTIGANLLGVNGIIKTKTYFYTTATATGETYTIKLYYGGSAIQTITHTVNAIGGGNASTWSGVIEGWIINNGATNSQNVSFISIGGIQWSNNSNLTPNYPSAPADTTSAIDTTSSQTLKMTVQRSNGSGASGAFGQTIVETIKNA